MKRVCGMPDSPKDTTARPVQEAERRLDRVFIRRLMLTTLVAAGFLVAWRLSDVILLAFASVLLALVLRGLAGSLSRRTRFPEAWMVAPVVLVVVAIVAAIGWLFGTQISSQFDSLAKVLPAGARQLTQDFSNGPWSAWLIDQAQGIDLSSVLSQAAGSIRTFFTSAFRAIAYLALFIFAGIYLAVQPARNREGVVRLIPSKRRARVGAVFDLAGETLKRWVVGQSITMLIVGALTGFGLWAIGIGAPLALGLIAGTLAFVPFIGPILASVPGILVAATQGPMPVLYAALLYIGVHFIEGNLLNPLVQAEVVKLPPVVTLFAALIFGLLFGPIGVLLAAPLTVVLLVAVNCLYIEHVLGDRRVWPPVAGAGSP
jgi:predicted PurR-regulated permease PerM